MVLALVVGLLAWWVIPAAPLMALPAEMTRAGRHHDDVSSIGWVEDPWRRGAVCMCGVGLTLAVILGPAWGPVGLVVGAILSWFLGRLEPPSAARSRLRIAADLPLTADLLAACARVGEPVSASLAAVVEAVGGPVGHELALVDARIRLGSDPVTEWRRLDAHPQLCGLARTIIRCLESGAPIADGLDRFAEDRRRELRMVAQARARSVGVKSAGPLAACFLPAFVAIGIVPTVAAAFETLVLGR